LNDQGNILNKDKIWEKDQKEKGKAMPALAGKRSCFALSSYAGEVLLH
jgi:hypothetical protein